jgi:hypothetical protein
LFIFYMPPLKTKYSKPGASFIPCVFRAMRHRFQMRKILAGLFTIFTLPAFAQMGGGSSGTPNGMDQLFSATPVYTATMQTAISGPNGSMSITSKIFYDHGDSRNELDMTNVQGANLPPNAIPQAKALGVDYIVTIAPATHTNIYTMYPLLHSYFSVPADAPGTAAKDGITQTTPVGNETVAGHPCVKNKVTVNAGGQPHVFTVWNATDLKNFPVQIYVSEEGTTATFTYQNISFTGVPASFFRPPSNYKSYDNIESLMQAAVMTRMGSIPPPTPVVPPSPPTQ